MMILKKVSAFFKNLQQKPEEVRRRWLWIFVIGVMVVVAGFWSLSTVKNLQIASPSPTPEEKVQGKTGFVAVFGIGLKSIFRNLTQFLKPIVESISYFFANVFSSILKGGDWLIKTLVKTGEAIKERLHFNFGGKFSVISLGKINQEIGLQINSYFRLVSGFLANNF